MTSRTSQQALQLAARASKRAEEMGKRMQAMHDRALKKSLMFGINYGVQSGSSATQPVKPQPKPAPKPSIRRALSAAFSVDERIVRWADFMLLAGMWLHLARFFTRDPEWLSVIFVLAGVVVIFYRGRLTINSWKDQKLAWFNSTMPKTKVEIHDSQTLWMRTMKSFILLVGLILLLVKLSRSVM